MTPRRWPRSLPALLALIFVSLPCQTIALASAKQKFHYAGVPKRTNYPNPLKILTNVGYEVGYDEVRKNPAWSAYRVFKISKLTRLKRPGKFSVDGRTQAKVRHEDYTGRGYDRGHMTPNFAIASRFGEQAQLETFLMSNICPQKAMLNQQVWEHLEDREANQYAQQFDEVWIVDGPIYGDSPKKFPSGVVIPKSFFKIILDEQGSKPRVLAFIMPQTVRGSEDPKQFLTSVRAIEKATGLDFNSELPDTPEKQLEETTAKEMW